jgi:succinylglutamate desuccinylase
MLGAFIRARAMLSNALNDLEAFTHYAESYLATRTPQASLEDSLSAFRAHQRDLQRLRDHIAPSIAEADRGEFSPLDEKALFERIRHDQS